MLDQGKLADWRRALDSAARHVVAAVCDGIAAERMPFRPVMTPLQDSNPAYQQLLQAELLGRPAAGSPERTASFRDTSGPGGGLGSPSHSPAKKMLRFQAGDR